LLLSTTNQPTNQPPVQVKTGQSATFAIRSLNRKFVLKKSSFRKGMVLIDGLNPEKDGGSAAASSSSSAAGASSKSLEALAPRACREFEASVVILHHSTTICCGYQPVIHCGVLRQSAEMIEIKGRENLKTGESKWKTVSCIARF
jgi:GTPase